MFIYTFFLCMGGVKRVKVCTCFLSSREALLLIYIINFTVICMIYRIY